MTGSWSFRCTACGKCCNSGPELSLPELFRHQHRFVGRLAVRKVSRPPAFDVLLVTHAWHDERFERCPALAADGRCSLHDADKPLVCRIAPLDALAPDRAQHAVLSARSREAAFFGADCIVPGERPGYAPLLRHLRVIEPGAQAALARRRAELVLEKRYWGDDVFRLLAPELFDRPERLAKIPPHGYLSFSIAPVLMTLGDVSPACRARCIEYLDAQLALAERLEVARVVRGHAELRAALARAGQRAPRAPHAATAAATEAWLGLEAA